MKRVTLYAKSSTDKTKQWSIEVKKLPDNKAEIITLHGEMGGALTEVSTIVTEGKNIGKANETTSYDQAIKEAESKIQKKRDKGYFDNESNIVAPVLPMLALKYTERSHDIIWPAYIQPKLNGMRCMAHMTPSGIEMLSRMGKPIAFSHHIKDELDRLFKYVFTLTNSESDFYLDGELFKHGMLLQDIVRATRKQSGETDRSEEAGIEYHIYDCFKLDSPGEVANWTFENRHKFIEDILVNNKPSYKHIKPVLTEFVVTPSQALTSYSTHIQNGFEGGMLRNAMSEYKMGHRSADLQKMKQFLDAEYMITGYFEGKGSEAGCVNWTCITPEGREFGVRPRGTFEERQQLWIDRDKYIGKYLTVMYQEKTKDNIPHICVGVSIRDYE